MKKFIGYLISAMIAIITVCGLVGCTQTASVDPNTYAFVTIDINPSVELITLGGEVVQVKAANYDACILLDGEDFISQTVEDASARIVALAEELGYLTDTNNQVKITVISDDAQAVEILKSAAKSGAEKGSKKAQTSNEHRLEDEITVKKLKEEKPDKFANITEEKVRLIESVMEHNPEFTYEDGVDMTVNQLSSALEASVGEYKDIFTAELRSEYSARYAAAKQAIQRKIAAYFGNEYLAEWDKYAALDIVYNDIVTALDKTGLSEDDIISVSELLNISDVSLIEKGGVVKPEYVQNYINKHVSKKGSEVSGAVIEEVLQILEKYVIENHILSDGESSLIAEALGENVIFTQLSEVKANLEQRKDTLDAIEKSVQLTDAQVEQIREIKEEFNCIKENVLEDMRQSIAEARAEIAAAKQQRRSN